jgi:hypothetical protein
MLTTKASTTRTDIPVVDGDKGVPGKLLANSSGPLHRPITLGSAVKNEDPQQALMDSEYERLRYKHLRKLFLGLIGRRVSNQG